MKGSSTRIATSSTRDRARAARALFADQPYKLELINDILQRGTDEYGEKSAEVSRKTPSTAAAASSTYAAVRTSATRRRSTPGP